MTTDDATPLPSPDVTLRQLECFIAVAETGTITGAAAKIHSSGSAVSDAVTSLERVVGVPLTIRRRSQGVTLTSTGRTIVPLAREVLSRAFELELLARGDEQVVAPVRVGAFHTIAPTLLPPLIERFSAKHPEAEITYALDSQESLADRLGSGELDIALVYELDFPLEFERIRLVRSRAVVVLPEEHRLADRAAIELRELADEPLILHDVVPSRQHVIDLLNESAVEPPRIHAITNYDLCRSLVGQGLGWSILMGRKFAPKTWAGHSVVEIPIEPAPQPLSVIVAARKELHPPRVTDLIETACHVSREIMGSE